VQAITFLDQRTETSWLVSFGSSHHAKMTCACVRMDSGG
jgi:hypothetical protein